MHAVRSVFRSLAERFRAEPALAPAEPVAVAPAEPVSAAETRDPLTGLPTLGDFESALRRAVRQADAEKSQLALLCLTLDGFKTIDQQLGHPAGDHLLRAIAGRLRGFEARPDRLTRLAGDEFVLLLDGDPQPRDATHLARRVIEAVERPILIDGRSSRVACSIGIAMYPEHGALSTMLAHAHAAMAYAEQAGGSTCVFFEQRMLRGPREDRELLHDLRLALERDQFELFYQPKIHAPTGEVTGAEALLRWHHPKRGMVSPATFIPIAERYGLIGGIGHWVIDRACRQAREWRDEGLRMRVAVNLSVHQLRHPELPARIAEALERHQINPDLLTCEITESAAMEDIETSVQVLGELDRIGVHLSIDDFGTGHSSLAWLRKLPADELKIDRGFVMDLETSKDARTVALAIIRLAQALDLKVVAEGVETEAQNRILRDFGCDQLQGFLFAKPMAAATLTLWAMDDVGPRTLAFRDSLFMETAPAPL